MAWRYRNAAFHIAGETVWGFQWEGLAAWTVLPVLLLAHGATKLQVGLVLAIESAAFLPQFLGIYLFHSRRHRKRQLMRWYAFVTLPLFALIGAVNYSWLDLTGDQRCWLLLAAFGLHMTLTAVGVAAWNDWLAHLFDRSIRGRVMGLSWGLLHLAGVGGALLVGWIIDRTVEPSTDPNRYDVYTYLYFGGAAVGFVAMGLLSMIDDRAANDIVDPPPPPMMDILRRFRRSLGEPNYRRFLIGRVLATLGFGIATLTTAYYTSEEGGGIQAGMLIALGAAIPLGKAVGTSLLGVLGDRKGHRLGVVLGSAVQVATVVLLLTTRGPVSCVLAFGGFGLAMGAGFVCNVNMILETCPHDCRLSHITVSTMILALPLAAAPILSALVAETWGYQTLFGVCLVINIAALLWFVFRVREPRTLSVYASSVA